jgi:lysophospholipase L1-like esterase
MNQFTVLIDGQLAPKLVALAGPNDYSLASGLNPGPHRIEVYRRAEASFGPTQFLGLDLGADGALLPPPPVTRRIEIIGDSVSTGYGNEGVLPCPFTPETQNHYLTYGAIAARAVGAELSTVAWSGKGVVYNYGTDLFEPMPALYGRTLPQDPSSTYDFATVPDVVVVSLGTNDFSTDGDPTTEQFAEVYAGLLDRVRSNYPEAFILGTVGPLLGGTDLTAARAGIAAGVAAFVAAGGSKVRAWEMNVPNGAPPGCDYHPNLATHQAMADVLIPELEASFTEAARQ